MRGGFLATKLVYDHPLRYEERTVCSPLLWLLTLCSAHGRSLTIQQNSWSGRQVWYEPRHGKPCFSHMRKKSADQQYIDKLTRNKNASHIFPRHFLTVAMIGIICLYIHFVLYIFHTRSLCFQYLHYFRSYDNHCTKCTCASCAPTTRLFDAKICF